MPSSAPPDELPIFDRDAFEAVARVLAPALMTSYLRAVSDGCEALLSELRRPDVVGVSGSSLSEAAHQLSGSAGMLGFRRLARRAHEFECAVTAGAPDREVLAQTLEPVIEDTSAAIRHHVAKILAGRGLAAEVTQ